MGMFALLLISTLLVSATWGQTNGFCNLVWNDEFNGPQLDTKNWQIEQTCHGGGNNELQCYTARPKNVFMSNGSLVLKAYPETYTGTQAGCTDTQGCTNTKQFTSGRVNSRISPAGSFLRGRMEIRAKLASGSHLWPAIWMLPTDWSYGGWAASGEIDIMELRGNLPKAVSGTLHHGGSWPYNIWTTNGDKEFPEDLSQDYHVYALEWTENEMKWFKDNTNFQTLNMQRWWNSTVNNNPYTAKGQPWDKKFHFVLNLAIGGGYFNGYPALTNADVAAWKVTEMRVDYVRAWSIGGDCSKSPFDVNTGTNNNDIATSPNNNVAVPEGDWLAKNSPILFGVIGGVFLLAGIVVLAVGIYMTKKKQFELPANLSAGQSSTQMVTIFPGSP